METEQPKPDAAPPGMAWKRLDYRAIEQAKALLGITLPVKIDTHGRYGDTRGNYSLRCRDGRCFHRIMLKTYYTPEQAIKTLWHELQHAAQAEQAIERYPHLAPMAANNKMCKAQARYSYAIRPIEVEARATAEKYKDVRLAF